MEKKFSKIPVIANGDLTSASKALEIAETTKAAGVMIGRGAIGNPYIFHDISLQLEGQEAVPLTLQERLKFYQELIEHNVTIYGERTGVSRSKKTVGFWISGFEGASAMREKLVRANTLKEVNDIFAATTK